MPETLTKQTKNATDFIDALLVSIGQIVRPEIRKIIDSEEAYKWQIVDFDKFFEMEFNPDKIGTAVIRLRIDNRLPPQKTA